MSRRCDAEDRGERIVHFRTSQASHLKTIFDSLRDLIQDVNLHFIPDDAEDNTPGILMLAMDNSHVALAHMKLLAETIRRADEFTCTRQCSAGINVPGFWKYLKTMGTHDIVSISMYEKDKDHLYLVGENPTQQKSRVFKIKLLDIDEEKLEIPDSQFDCVFTMDAAEFQRLCRDLAAVEPDAVTIESTGNTLTWRAVGHDAEEELTLGSRTEDAQGVVFETQPCQKDISNAYSLKFLTMFTKATGLCKDIRIHLAPRYPIILDYDVPELGILRFCLAPRITDEENEEDDAAMSAEPEDLF